MKAVATESEKPAVVARPKTSSKLIYEQIKRAAIDGVIGFDQRLSEYYLAKMFGVSRTPIREAVFRLVQEGLVVKKDNSYFCMRRPTEEDLEDLLEVRIPLNNLLIDKLMANLDDRLMEELAENVEASQRFLEADDTANLNYALSEFHNIMYSGARSPCLEKILSGMVDEVLIGRSFALKLKGARWTLVAEHQKILDALKKKDRVEAKKRMREHLLNAKKRALEVLLMDRLREISESEK